MKIEHVALNVPEPTKLVKWYVEHLAMRVARSNNDANETHFIVDEAGVAVLEVYNNPASPMPDYSAMNPLVFHIAFAVDNMEGTLQRLVDAGAKPVGEVNTTPAGDRLAFLRDPWGIPLQLAQRAKTLL